MEREIKRVKKLPICGHSDCGVSSGIHEGPTFGRGYLDFNGFWKYPCGPCARAWEKLHPEDGECWPFEGSEAERTGVAFDDEHEARETRMFLVDSRND
jgi:hypothetical protein